MPVANYCKLAYKVICVTKWSWAWLMMANMAHNGPDNIGLLKTDIDLGMLRSSIQNALSEISDK